MCFYNYISYNTEVKNIHIIILRKKERKKERKKKRKRKVYNIYIFYKISVKNIYIFTLSKKLIFNPINDLFL